MAELPKGKATISRAPARDEGRPENTIAPLQIRYFRRMSSQRVYGVAVAWPKSRDERRAPAGTPPVTVRLLMAGAQVVPTEHTLDPADPDAKATFYVTPLAKGWLRNERLEILVAGRKVQEVPLPAKVGGQGLTWVLLLLAILLPWFLLSYAKYSPLTLTRADIENADIWKKPPNQGGLREAEKRTIMLSPDFAKAAKETVQAFRTKSEGEILAGRIGAELPAMPGFAEEGAIHTGLLEFREKIGDLYDNLIDWMRAYPIAFYVFLTFLVLALISFIVNQDKRKKRWSKPIAIPRSGADGLGARREEVIAAERG